MTIYTICVPGVMKGKQRPRISTRNGFARAYTPTQTVNLEAHIRQCALGDVGQIMLEGPIGLEMSIIVQVPASWSAKKRASALRGETRPTGKPDADNCLKAVDSLNGICWRDDSQIVDARVTKVYGETPITVIRIRDAEEFAL